MFQCKHCLVANVEWSSVPATFRLQGSCSPFVWHKVEESNQQTVSEFATSLGLTIFDLIFFNRRLFPELSAKHLLKSGMFLRIPVFPKHFDVQRKTNTIHSRPIKVSQTKEMVVSTLKKGMTSSSGLFYCTKEQESPQIIAKKLEVDAKALVLENVYRFPSLEISSRLLPKTVLRLPNIRPSLHHLKEFEEISLPASEDELYRNQVQQDWGFFEENEFEEELTEPMCYRHWSFTDDPIEFTHASYMMVKVLRKSEVVSSNESFLKTIAPASKTLFPFKYENFLHKHRVFGGKEVDPEMARILKEEAEKGEINMT